MNCIISPAGMTDASVVAELVGELQHEIMLATGGKDFQFELLDAQTLAEDLINRKAIVALSPMTLWISKQRA
jgi:hypothetical protein